MQYLRFPFLLLTSSLKSLILQQSSLRFLDDVEWAFLFPVLILMFVIHQLNHPIRYSKRSDGFMHPFLYSAITSARIFQYMGKYTC
jgi:hypothetical protein